MTKTANKPELVVSSKYRYTQVRAVALPPTYVVDTIPGADAPAFVRALTRPKPKPPFEWAFHVFTTIQSKEKEDKKVCFVL